MAKKRSAVAAKVPEVKRGMGKIRRRRYRVRLIREQPAAARRAARRGGRGKGRRLFPR